jgi:hypothetical protein
VLARPELQHRIAHLGDNPAPPPPGPDRRQLLDLLAA